MKISIILISILITFCSCNKTVDGSITAPGVVDGDIIIIKSLVSGSIEKLPIIEGDLVTNKTLIAEIDSAKIRNRIDKINIDRAMIVNQQESIKNRIFLASKNYSYLKKQVARYRRLKAKDSVPGEKVEKLEVQFAEAVTNLKELKTSFKRTDIELQNLKNLDNDLKLRYKDHIIQCPVPNGVILEKYLSSGENVNPGSPIVEILDINSLYVEVFLEEEEINKLKIGDKVTITADGLNKSISAKILSFGKKAEFSPKYIISEKERRNLLFKVKVGFSIKSQSLKIGMPVTVTL